MIDREKVAIPAPSTESIPTDFKHYDGYDYTLKIENTGQEPIWIRCLLHDISQSKLLTILIIQ
jgi:hypothetical protein